MYQISLLAAFLAGMVALFAPCCITYLLPGYLGNIFKERKQVLLMTLIYSLGIMVVMLPVVLGAKMIATLFFTLHDQTYFVGGLVMLVVAVLSFLGIKLPMPMLAMRQDGQRTDVWSTFVLGVFAGITSACCAPVLIGVLALSSLSPTVLMSLGVGVVYVLGMVAPLYLASLFIDQFNLLEKPLLKRKVTELKLFGKQYIIFVSNIIAAAIFLITGTIMLWLNSTGRLGMTTAEAAVAKSINDVAWNLTDALGAIPGIDVIFTFVGAYLLYKFVQRVFRGKDK